MIEHTKTHEYNISLYKGRLVEGNVFYRDTDLSEVHDLYTEETGNALLFEGLDTAGSKIVKYQNGRFSKLYLAYGNYSVTTEYISEEYEMDMEYTLQETIWVNPESTSFTFELNKENDYSFTITVDGESEVQLQSGNYYEKAFSIALENEGNTRNLIDLTAEDVPPGWVVHLSNFTIPLDITGKR